MIRLRTVGADGLLLEVDDPTGWFTELWQRRAAGELAAVEIVPGARTVLLDGLTDRSAAMEQVRQWARARTQPTTAPAAGDPATARVGDGRAGGHRTGAVVQIPVRYDGEDLGAVAARWDTHERGVVDLLCDTELRVAFCGFTPGWAYLAGLPAELSVPRLPTPRPRVPAGSVGLADGYAGIYPTSSPGGWLLVGRTDIRLFDPDRDPPALLTPGTRVRFVEVATA